MNLLILPGAGDPFHPSSIKATNLLIGYAEKHYFEKVRCLSYPGHKSFSDDNRLVLEIESTKKVMLEALREFQDYGVEFIVFVRSYGCNPYLDILANHNLILSNLKTSIVWGSSAYHFIYQGATEFFNMFYSEGLKRGTTMSEEIFKNTYPIENYIQKQLEHKVVFCSGSQDKYSPQYFYNYLKSLNKNDNNVFADLIDGEKHTITEPNKKYENLIFG